jgi:S1-C subfamily serine protease
MGTAPSKRQGGELDRNVHLSTSTNNKRRRIGNIVRRAPPLAPAVVDTSSSKLLNKSATATAASPIHTLTPNSCSSSRTSTTSTHAPTIATTIATPTATSASTCGGGTSALQGKEGVCLIENVSVEWVWTNPWQRTAQHHSTGSGFVISKHRILTNAHVVASAIDIRVRLHGSSRRFRAKTTIYAPDVDLAILELHDDDETQAFFGSSDMKDESLALEFASDLPALQERVNVVGFPSGGRTICVTEGVVSRIDNLDLANTADGILSIQIDAAINAGNSGGPVFDSRGYVTGVAFCKANSAGTDNIGYVIPADVVRAFLGRCHEDGSYSFSPSVPYTWHSLENKSLRLYHKVPDTIHGILLTEVSETVKGALQAKDVLVKIDDHEIADDGQVVLRGDELIQHRYLMRGKRIDEKTTFTVYRKGKLIESKPCILKYIPDICPRWPNVDHLPDYLIVGALAFLPMSHMIMTKKDAGTRLYATYWQWVRRWPQDWDDKEELVLLTNIFAHELSFSYHRNWRRVLQYNGTPVKSLRHLTELWEASCQKAAKSSKQSFARIELEDDDDIVLEVHTAMQAQAEILETHQISKPSQISPRNQDKYRIERKGK